MMRYGRWIGLLVAALIGAQIVVRGASSASVSTADEFSEAVLPGGRVQACWHGLCPGLITIRKAAAVLNATESLRPLDSTGRGTLNNMACWKAVSKLYDVCLTGMGGTLDTISLYYYYDADLVDTPVSSLKFRLGDLVAAWGAPVRINATYCQRSRILFRNNIEVVYPWNQRSEMRYFPALELNPALPQTAVFYIVAKPSTAFAQVERPWQGFVGTREPIPCGSQ